MKMLKIIVYALIVNIILTCVSIAVSTASYFKAKEGSFIELRNQIRNEMREETNE